MTDGSHNPPQGIDNSEYMMLSSKNVFDDKITFDEPRFLSEEDFKKEHKRTKVSVGDVLLTIVGTVGRTAVVDEDMPLFVLQRSVAVLHPKTDVCLPRFLMYALRGKRTFIENRAKGVAQKGIYLKDVSDIDVQVPDISTQEMIINLLDKVDTIVKFRKEELLALDNLIKARFVEMFDSIKDICEVGYYIKSLTAGKSLAGEAECENKVLKTGAASFDFFDATQVKNLPVDYEPKEEHLVNVGDIIISRMNTAELTGAAAYVWDVPGKVYLPDRLWKAVLDDNSNPIFVWQMLIQPSTKEQIQRECSGTSGSMKNISKAGMLGIKVKKVPLEMQDQFADFVKQVDKSKVAIQAALDKSQLLFDSLMQKYFG